MLGDKMEKALNGQVNAELYSAYLYLSMVANFTAQNWVGAAKWMRVQTTEEVRHAMMIYDYILECNSQDRAGADREAADAVAHTAGGVRGGLRARAESHRIDPRRW